MCKSLNICTISNSQKSKNICSVFYMIELNQDLYIVILAVIEKNVITIGMKSFR